MMLCFELSMPKVGSWNSKWSSAVCYFAKVVNFGCTKKGIEKAQTILNTGYFSYSFGDGWVAGIRIKKVNAKEGAKIRRKSKGFCGYDWMIDSIKQNNCIQTN